MSKQYVVAISKEDGYYNTISPYHPDEAYPECHGKLISATNPAFRAVRKNFYLMGMDTKNYNTPEWNPLGELITPGDSVFIKPNLVSHEYGRKNSQAKGDLFSVITHPSVVRAIAEYTAIALKGKGEITIGDNPSIDANFDEIRRLTGLDKVCEYLERNYHIKCRFIDLRPLRCKDVKDYGYKYKMSKQTGDPKGKTVVNLATKSLFYGLNPLLFRGVFKNRWETMMHHRGSRHEYSISNSIYQSDVYISVPKLKAHHKVGATLNIKGLVGTCADKNYLIHWRIGSPGIGGDEYPVSKKIMASVYVFLKSLCEGFLPEKLLYFFSKKMFKDKGMKKKLGVPSYSGSWDGNDTCWRMAADLYNALCTRSRKYFTVIDGIVGGEGDGPFCPGARNDGVIISGDNLVATDCAAVRMMDFDLKQVKYLSVLLKMDGISLSDVKIVSRDFDVSAFFDFKNRKYLGFQPPKHWPDLGLNK